MVTTGGGLGAGRTNGAGYAMAELHGCVVATGLVHGGWDWRWASVMAVGLVLGEPTEMDGFVELVIPEELVEEGIPIKSPHVLESFIWAMLYKYK